jgi:hypothetical protein
MAVSTTDTFSGPYQANGVTVEFPFTFKAVAASDVGVFVRDGNGNDVLVADTAYTVALAAEGGTVVISPAPTAGEVYIFSEPTFLQPVSFASGQPFLPAVVNEVNDRDVARALWLRDQITRAPVLPIGGGGALGKYPRVNLDGTWGFSVGSGGGGAGTHISTSVFAEAEGQTTFDFSDAPDVFWQALAGATAPPVFSVNGTTLDDEDYSWAAPALVINDEHMHVDDIVSIIVGVTFDQGVVDRRNVVGLPAYITTRFSSRRANTEDINDWDETGTHDNATGLITLINQAADAKVPLDRQGGRALLGRPIPLRDGMVMNGLSHGEEGGDPRYMSCFLLAHSGKGFISSGNSNAGMSINNIATARSQPPVIPGQPWFSNDHDYDWYFPYINGLKMHRIATLSATKGIFFNGGRNNIKEWAGQCFRVGLRSDYSYDTCLIQDVHFWPYLMQQDEVRRRTQAKDGTGLTSWHLHRCDNWFMSQIFSIWHNYGILIDHFAGDGNPAHPAGTASKLKVSQADLDIGNIGYIVAEDANGHTAELSQVSAQGLNEPSSLPAMSIQGPNTRILGDFAGDRCGNVVRLEDTAVGSVIKLRLSSQSYDIENLGYPPAEVNGAGTVDILPGSSLVPAGVGAASGAGVTVWTP